MDLYIRIKDGQPFEHPILGTNFKTAFTNVDVNNLPPEFAQFERVEKPVVGVYDVYEGVTYEWVEGVVKDVHHIRQMTVEEKTAKQEAAKALFPNHENEGYVFDENTCSFISKIAIGVTRV
jgi:hypothetical protein